jgi:EAL domain-containing protein (putative c-di-GMP-specific phosphodiesterase class I)
MLLEQYSVAPERIKLEINRDGTSGGLGARACDNDELNRRGIGVYLDDFAQGIANLSMLMTLPFECVKIDKGFIRNVATHPKSLSCSKPLCRD